MGSITLPPGFDIKALATRRGFGSSTKYIMSLIVADLDKHREPHTFIVMKKRREIIQDDAVGEM